MSRVLICGDRKWGNHWVPNSSWSRMLNKQDTELLFDTMDAFDEVWEIDTVIEGEAKGADRWGRLWAENYRKDVWAYPAEWEFYGKAAGPIRNTKMLKEGNPDFVVAFHRNLEASKGTAHMVKIARKAGLPVFVIPDYAYL